MSKRYPVRLTDDERADLRARIASGQLTGRPLVYAHVLLDADRASGGLTRFDTEIAMTHGLPVPTVEVVRKRYATKGIEAALTNLPPRHYPHKLNNLQEDRLVGLACGPPPAGRVRWTLSLLAERFAAVELGQPISLTLVRQTLLRRLGPGAIPAPPDPYPVRLTDDERSALGARMASGQLTGRPLTHARILLEADRAPGGPARLDPAIVTALGVSNSTVKRVRKRYVLEGLEAAIIPRSRWLTVSEFDGAWQEPRRRDALERSV